ncbi:MAG: Fic family protein [Chloroflexi bacterium]|nr:Fic family protein [Chloroflexota bacterium]MDA1010556.1 Fic family protein [Chloroflexota bacterium]
MLFDRARGAFGEFLGEARGIANERLITGPLLTIEAVRSNQIEGTHTQIVDVLRQQASGSAPTGNAVDDENINEVIRYQRALQLGEEWIAQGRGLSQVLLRGLHAELLQGTRGDHHHPGEYRATQVVIGNSKNPSDARFVPPPYEHIQPLMDNLETYISAEGARLPPLMECAIAHYQLETIHPFEDGNGRMGRLLIPLYLTHHKTADRPLLYLSAFFASNEEEYREGLLRVSTHGEWERWISFFLRGVEQQSTESTAHVRKLAALRTRYAEMVRSRTKSQAALTAIDLIMSDIFVTIPKVQAYANSSYGGARDAVAALEEIGILAKLDNTYPAMWFAQILFDEVYS